MSTQVLMPALSPTMTEGKLAKWLKKVGDEVKAGDVIAEIETDKATMEVEAVDEGTLSRILIEEGTEGVPVNTPIALLGEGDAADAPAPVAVPPPPPKAAEAPKPAAAPRAGARPGGRGPPPRRSGARPARSRCARRCATRWRPRCGATRTCS